VQLHKIDEAAIEILAKRHGMLVITFESDQMIINFSIEGNYPSTKAWKLLIEDNSPSTEPKRQS
jgi:hypothetical protein